MIRIALTAAVLTPLLAACAMTPQETARYQAREDKIAADLEKRLANYEPGRPQSCIRPYQADMTIYGDTLIYRQGSTLYRTETTGCSGLRRDDIVVTKSINGELCRGDIVRTIDRSVGMLSGVCSFGEFTPYKRIKQS